jgi:hypothetical protein
MKCGQRKETIEWIKMGLEEQNMKRKGNRNGNPKLTENNPPSTLLHTTLRFAEPFSCRRRAVDGEGTDKSVPVR